MMTKSKFRSALSLVLALIMMAGLWVPAWATDDPNPEGSGDGEVGQVFVGSDGAEREVDGVYVEAGTGSVEKTESGEFTVSDSSGDFFVQSFADGADAAQVTIENPIVTNSENAALDVGNLSPDISISLDVTASDVINEGTGDGVHVVSSSADQTAEVATGDIEAGGDGLHAMTAGGGEIKAETGNIQAGGDGVTAGSKEDGGSIEIHTGTIRAGSDGIETSNDGKESTVKVTVGSEESPADVIAEDTAVIVHNEAGSTEITVTQNVNGSDGIQINLTDGTVNVAVGGDAAAAETGLEVSEAAKDFPVTGEATVEIAGTLHVDEGGTPVLLGSGITPENVEITVWKVEIGDKQAEAGEIVRQGDASEPQSEIAKTVEENINYIIKIDPQQSGSSLSSNKGTAKANETVKITVTIPEGHTLKAVYTDEGKTLTAKDNGDGTFTLTVPVGGGVYVHADFEKQTMPMPGSVPVPVHRVSPPPPVPVPPPARRLDSQQEGTSFIYRPGGTYFTLLANTVSDLMNRRGIKTFIIEMNGKTYTIIAEDLLAWFGGTPSVTMHVDGDKLVLNFERGETVILDSDETLAAKQKEQYENDKRGDLPEATDKSTAAAAAAASAERVVAAARMAAELAAMAAAAEAAGIKTNVPIEPKVARQPDPFIRKPNPPVPVPAPARPSERRPGLPPLLPFQMPSIPDEPEVPEETTDSEELEQNNELDNRKADALMPDGTVEVRAGPAGS